MKTARKTMTSEVSESEFEDIYPVAIRRGHLKESRKKVTFVNHQPKKQEAKPICKGKVRYRDREEAVDTLHQIQKIKGYKDGTAAGEARRENRAYSCPTCRGAHLTSKPQLADPVLKLVPTLHVVPTIVWELAHVA